MEDNSSSTSASLHSPSCAYLTDLFPKINQYFRDETIIEGTEHSSLFIGNLIIIAYSVVIFFGTCGNLLTIIAILRNPQMRTVRNFFILNLALSDFLICTVTAPVTMYTIVYTFWPFGTAMCKVAGTLQGFNIFLSTFSIAAIALDRYVLVIFPTKRQRQHNLSLLFFSMIWLISIIFALPLFIASDIHIIFKKPECGIAIPICHEQNEIWKEMSINKKTYTIAVMVVQYAFPIISMSFSYSSIALRMRMRFAARSSLCTTAAMQNNAVNQRRKSVVERQRRTHLLLICLIVVFATAWLPLNVFHILNTFELTTKFDVPVFALCHILGITSACINPLSYAFFNQNIRQEFGAMFRETRLLWIYDKVVALLSNCKSQKTVSEVEDNHLDNQHEEHRDNLIPTNYITTENMVMFQENV
ncbi:hypothetical protein FO519_004324 [Halicephalobus sp. NKZ332]|nr:hypothetical protein FO519_004324 [Halicephalobus sp. NKZ332]